MVRAGTKTVVPAAALASAPQIVDALPSGSTDVLGGLGQPLRRLLCVNYGMRVDVHVLPEAHELCRGAACDDVAPELAAIADFPATAAVSLPNGGSRPITDMAAMALPGALSGARNVLVTVDEGGAINALCFRLSTQLADDSDEDAAETADADEETTVAVVRQFACRVPTAMWPLPAPATLLAPSEATTPKMPGVHLTTSQSHARATIVASPGGGHVAVIHRFGAFGVRLGLLAPDPETAPNGTVVVPSLSKIDGFTKAISAEFVSPTSLGVLLGPNGGSGGCVTGLGEEKQRGASSSGGFTSVSTATSSLAARADFTFVGVGGGGRDEGEIVFMARSHKGLAWKAGATKATMCHWVHSETMAQGEQALAARPVGIGGPHPRNVVLTSRAIYIHDPAAGSATKLCDLPADMKAAVLAHTNTLNAVATATSPDVRLTIAKASSPALPTNGATLSGFALISMPSGVISVDLSGTRSRPAWLLRTAGAVTAMATLSPTGDIYTAGAHGIIRHSAHGYGLPLLASFGSDAGSNGDGAVRAMAYDPATKSALLATSQGVRRLGLAEEGCVEDAEPCGTAHVVAVGPVAGGRVATVTAAGLLVDGAGAWRPEGSSRIVLGAVAGARSPFVAIALDDGDIVLLRVSTSGSSPMCTEACRWAPGSTVTTIGVLHSGESVAVLGGSHSHTKRLRVFSFDDATATQLAETSLRLPKPTKHEPPVQSEGVHGIVGATDSMASCAVVTTTAGRVVLVYATSWWNWPSFAYHDTAASDKFASVDPTPTGARPLLACTILQNALPAPPVVAIADAPDRSLHAPNLADSKLRFIKQLRKRQMRHSALVLPSDDAVERSIVGGSEANADDPDAVDPTLPQCACSTCTADRGAWPQLSKTPDATFLRILVVAPGVTAMQHVVTCLRSGPDAPYVPFADDFESTRLVLPPMADPSSLATLGAAMWGGQPVWLYAAARGRDCVGVWGTVPRDADVVESVSTHKLADSRGPLQAGATITGIALAVSAGRMGCAVVHPDGRTSFILTQCTAAHVSVSDSIDLPTGVCPMAVMSLDARRSSQRDRQKLAKSEGDGKRTDSDAVAAAVDGGGSFIVGAHLPGHKGALLRIMLAPLRIVELVERPFSILGLSLGPKLGVFVAATEKGVDYFRIGHLAAPVCSWKAPVPTLGPVAVNAAPHPRIATGDPAHGAYTATVATGQGFVALRLEDTDDATRNPLAPDAVFDNAVAAATASPARAAGADAPAAGGASPQTAASPGPGSPSPARAHTNDDRAVLRAVCEDRLASGVDLVCSFAHELRESVKATFAVTADAKRNLRIVQVVTRGVGGPGVGDMPFAGHGAAVRLPSQPTCVARLERMVQPRVSDASCPMKLCLSDFEAPAVETLCAIANDVDATTANFVARDPIIDGIKGAMDSSDLTEPIGTGVAVGCRDGSVVTVVPLAKRMADVLTTIEQRSVETMLAAPMWSSKLKPSPALEVPASIALAGATQESRRLWSPVMTSIGTGLPDGDVLERLVTLWAVALAEDPEAAEAEDDDGSAASASAAVARRHVAGIVASAEQDFPLLTRNNGAAMRRTLIAFRSVC